MYMKSKNIGKIVVLATAFWLSANTAAAQHKFVVTRVQGSTVSIDSTYDAHPDTAFSRLIEPYKEKVHVMMTTPIGVSAARMGNLSIEKPEGLLPNLIADVIRRAGKKLVGRTCDMALMNKGGIRTILPAGNIMMSTIYEIMPFENSIAVVKMKGTLLKQLMSEIAKTGGQGVSGARLVITKNRTLVSATVGGRQINDKKDYYVATINYLAEGNDGFASLADKSTVHFNNDNMLLRSTFIDFVKAETAAGRKLTSKLEGRITMEE